MSTMQFNRMDSRIITYGSVFTNGLEFYLDNFLELTDALEEINCDRSFYRRILKKSLIKLIQQDIFEVIHLLFSEILIVTAIYYYEIPNWVISKVVTKLILYLLYVGFLNKWLHKIVDCFPFNLVENDDLCEEFYKQVINKTLNYYLLGDIWHPKTIVSKTVLVENVKIFCIVVFTQQIYSITNLFCLCLILTLIIHPLYNLVGIFISNEKIEENVDADQLANLLYQG